MVTLQVQFLKWQFPLDHGRKGGQFVVSEMKRKYGSVLVVEEVLRYDVQLIVVGVQRAKLVASNQPIRELPEAVETDIDVFEVCRCCSNHNLCQVCEGKWRTVSFNVYSLVDM